MRLDDCEVEESEVTREARAGGGGEEEEKEATREQEASKRELLNNTKTIFFSLRSRIGKLNVAPGDSGRV